MSYNAIAMVTDYDCWKDDTEAVDAQHVLKVIKENVERVRALFVQAVKFIGQHDWEDVIKSNQVIFLIAIFLTAILQYLRFYFFFIQTFMCICTYHYGNIIFILTDL